MGDVLLGQVAQRMKARFRQSDTLARIGGDEFALILDTLRAGADAERAAESVLEMLKPTFEIDGHSIRITASIGISIFPDHARGRAAAAAGRLRDVRGQAEREEPHRAFR